MYILTCKSFQICCGTAEEILSRQSIDTDYIIAQTEFSQTKDIARLLASGFCFHDRQLKMDISISRTLERFSGIFGNTNGVSVSETEHFTGEMLDMALTAFDMDRRFHLEQGFGSTRRVKEVLESAVAHYQEGRHKIFRTDCQGNLVGCVLIRDIGSGIYENVLGFTRPGIAGKAAAIPLYVGALKQIGSGGGKRYLGSVSSTNMASLNLHIQLGAKVTAITDWYIFRKHDEKT